MLFRSSCDRILSDYEATRKYPSGGFVDLCNHCYRTIKDDVVSIDRPDLEGIIDVEELEEFDSYE